MVIILLNALMSVLVWLWQVWFYKFCVRLTFTCILKAKFFFFLQLFIHYSRYVKLHCFPTRAPVHDHKLLFLHRIQFTFDRKSEICTFFCFVFFTLHTAVASPHLNAMTATAWLLVSWRPGNNYSMSGVLCGWWTKLFAVCSFLWWYNLHLRSR